MLATLGDTWVITRADYKQSIEEELQRIPERDTLHFVYVELPSRARFWQRELRGLRIYYLLWQIAALRKARKLHREVGFDVVWHLTWASAWIGSLGALTGPPFVYGPVGGCVGTLWRMLPHVGLRGASYELARGAVHVAGRYLNPLARISWRKADLILVQNHETRAWLPARHRSRAQIFPNALVRDEVHLPQLDRAGRPTALFAGRLEGFKGVFLALRALRRLPEWRLVICGTGSDEQRLRKLAIRLGVDDRIEWVGWVDRLQVLRHMQEADAFIFPSWHEEAGAAVLEALSAGLPVVGLDRGGVPILVGDSGRIVSSRGGAEALARRLADALEAGRPEGSTGTKPTSHRIDAFSPENRAAHLRRLLKASLDLDPEATPAHADGGAGEATPAQRSRG
jgi:glycosyltransferase involved in cell wall biosynthesis